MAKRAADINEITRNLREMKLPAMAEALNQLFLSADFSTYSSLELVDTIVNEEKMSRKNHTVEKRLKQATLTNSQARLESIEYLPGRNINKALIDQLKTNEYIRDGRNVEILGATGCGNYVKFEIM